MSGLPIATGVKFKVMLQARRAISALFLFALNPYESPAASCLSALAPSPLNDEPCMIASVRGCSAANRSNVVRVFAAIDIA